MIDLDELRSVQSRERQTDSLQQLRETFYQDAGEYIQQLHRERERAADEADDPWDAPAVNRLSNDIDTAEQTVEAIYERRVGKIVKMASLAAADMPTEDEGLTTEERTLFETLVAAIERNRTNVEAVIDGEDPAHVGSDAGPLADVPTDTDPSTGASASSSEPANPTPDTAGDADHARTDIPTDPTALEDEEAPTPPPESADPTDADDVSQADSPGDPPTDSEVGGNETSVDAANLMGADGPDPAVTTEETDRQTDGGTGAVGGVESAGSGPAGEAPDESLDRTIVRITSDIGEIFGVDQRSYDLSEEDVVTLPEANAGPLVEHDAAERLD